MAPLFSRASNSSSSPIALLATGTRWAARITGQLLVDKANTFTFDLENREGAKLWIAGRLAVANDFNAGQEAGTKRQRSHMHLTAVGNCTS